MPLSCSPIIISIIFASNDDDRTRGEGHISLILPSIVHQAREIISPMKQGVWCLAERLDEQSLLTEIVISQNYHGQATNCATPRFPIIHTNQISPVNRLY